MAYIHEDTIWINAHPTTETDLDKIESMFICSIEDEKIIKGEQNENL